MPPILPPAALLLSSVAIRTTTHKLVKHPNFPEFTEVFDLIADPDEFNNLTSDEVLTSKLDAELQQLAKSVTYTMPSSGTKAGNPDPAKP